MLYNIYNLILFKSSNISKLYCTFEIFIIASAVDVKKSKNALLSEREKSKVNCGHVYKIMLFYRNCLTNLVVVY